MVGVQVLADGLTRASESQYVRLVASWVQRSVQDPGRDLLTEPALTGDRVVDALVAAAVEHVWLQVEGEFPQWTVSADRRLETFWYPGYLFANALVHSPPSFKNRCLLIEADSLESV